MFRHCPVRLTGGQKLVRLGSGPQAWLGSICSGLAGTCGQSSDRMCRLGFLGHVMPFGHIHTMLALPHVLAETSQLWCPSSLSLDSLTKYVECMQITYYLTSKYYQPTNTFLYVIFLCTGLGQSTSQSTMTRVG